MCEDDVAVHWAGARHGSITGRKIPPRVNMHIRAAAFADISQNAAVARKRLATIGRDGQPDFSATILFLLIALVNPGDVNAALLVYSDGLKGVSGGFARAVGVDGQRGREGFAAVRRARKEIGRAHV